MMIKMSLKQYYTQMICHTMMSDNEREIKHYEKSLSEYEQTKTRYGLNKNPYLFCKKLLHLTIL